VSDLGTHDRHARSTFISDRQKVIALHTISSYIYIYIYVIVILFIANLLFTSFL
jgi:hypothetical protein